MEARQARQAEAQARRDELNAVRRRKGMQLLDDAPERDDPASAWRLAASWVECFTPVLWQRWDAARREATAAPDEVKGALRIVAVDDKPFMGAGRTAGGRQPQMFAVLVASEIELDASGAFRTNRVRLIRSYPDHKTESYLLLFDELGYLPDVVLSDGGPAIRGALERLAEMYGRAPVRVMSSYHVVSQVKRNLDTMANQKTHPYVVPTHLLTRLENYECLLSRASWDMWWADLVSSWDAQGIPERQRMKKWQREYLPLVRASLELTESYPGLPRSTGNIEALFSATIEPALMGRAERFGNLARTNQLPNLMTLSLNRQLNDPVAVAEQLRLDVRRHGGYAPPTRFLADPGPYRSLLDKDLPRQLAENRGMTR